jgi:hypothetical protein
MLTYRNILEQLHFAGNGLARSRFATAGDGGDSPVPAPGRWPSATNQSSGFDASTPWRFAIRCL